MQPVQTRKLELTCPHCNSGEVVYSCEPKCCFNHVCAECQTTFEPLTIAAGGKAAMVIHPPRPLPDACDPTAACAVCESVRVYMVDADRLVCQDCASWLRLELTDICPPGSGDAP
jgi:hypothetical protein